jgi:predicted ABC-type ATPase
VSAASRKPCIYVLAGPNGAGKSSILGAMMLEARGDYFNPDVVATRLQTAHPHFSREEVNSIAWNFGRDLLERVIRGRQNFAFETTLGGKTITSLLDRAVSAGLQVRLWFVCLATPELHIQRVRARVLLGGHDIPEQRIRERYERSRENLLRLLPKLTELRLYDNSFEAALRRHVAPRPKLVLHCRAGRIVSSCPPAETPGWAKPIVEVAIRFHQQQ